MQSGTKRSFNLYNFIFQTLIWKIISVYWTLKEWKTAEVQNHSVSAYCLSTQMIGPFKFWHVYCCHVYFIFCEILRYVQAWNNILSPLKGWPTCIGILWKWATMLTKLAGDGECRLAWFHAIRNFLANEIYNFSRLSQQTGYLFTRAAYSK